MQENKQWRQIVKIKKLKCKKNFSTKNRQKLTLCHLPARFSYVLWHWKVRRLRTCLSLSCEPSGWCLQLVSESTGRQWLCTTRSFFLHFAPLNDCMQSKKFEWLVCRCHTDEEGCREVNWKNQWSSRERERAKTQANVNKLNNFSDGSKVESIRAQKCTQLS